MSYDISVGKWSGNYTSNVSALFYDHMPESDNVLGGLNGLHGLKGREAGDRIAEAFERISHTRRKLYVDGAIGEPAFCAKYDAKNGWGSAIGGLVFLAEIMAACYQHPLAKVSVG